MIICVYSSSSDVVEKKYFESAYNLGKEIAKRGDTLIYGGGRVGLMGACAKGVHDGNGKVVGVIPKALNIEGVVYDSCDDLIITEDMRSRKKIMDEQSDAVIALPGGFGTLEELFEMITLKQLKYHCKPIAILNTEGYYNPLIELFERVIQHKFAKEYMRSLYYVSSDVRDILNYIDAYEPVEIEQKWF
ncbi:MAG: TIGR00730 family Rossman fold protein [Clostridiales bacterium]|nr:TIGR00730 family Rossman fold protein [Clostridiales bacterium]